jgi:hypothetical protein
MIFEILGASAAMAELSANFVLESAMAYFLPKSAQNHLMVKNSPGYSGGMLIHLKFLWKWKLP